MDGYADDVPSLPSSLLLSEPFSFSLSLFSLPILIAAVHQIMMKYAAIPRGPPLLLFSSFSVPFSLFFPSRREVDGSVLDVENASPQYQERLR